MTERLSVIIPASNEEGWIAACLSALFASDPPGVPAQAVVVANGCRDATAAAARALAGKAARVGWQLDVLDLAAGGKPGALNAGDAAATGSIRVYLDADVTVSPRLIRLLVDALACDGKPRYATGRPVVAPARSRVTRAYARFWSRLPFATGRAPGFGLFAVNEAGRARWGAFPAIISDDTFVRLQFAPEEREEVAATYLWPMVEGFGPLVRVRRRQDAGVAEIARRWPDLPLCEGKPPLSGRALGGLALRDPVGFAVYAGVSAAVRLSPGGGGWTRGR
ncbi:MAG: glycosyltransferase [Gemmobacter sp.]